MLLQTLSANSDFYSQIRDYIDSETYLFKVFVLVCVIFMCSGKDTESPNVGPLV